MASRWQQDEERASPPPQPQPPYIKHHLHFMSLNCFCCPPPHRLRDFVPVTVHPLHPWRSCDRLRWTFCLHPPHCVPEIRKYYLPVGSWYKKKKGGCRRWGWHWMGEDKTGGVFKALMGKVIVLKACLWPHDGEAMMCGTPRHLLSTKVIMRISQRSTDTMRWFLLLFYTFAKKQSLKITSLCCSLNCLKTRLVVLSNSWMFLRHRRCS